MGRELIFTGPSPAGWHPRETVLRCSRLYAYEHVLGLKLGKRDALVRGSLIHVGQAHHWTRFRAQQRGENPDRWYEPVDAVMAAAAEMNASEDLTRIATQATFQYLEQVPLPKRSEVLLVEEVLEAQIGGHRYTARADVVFRTPRGVVIWDHKTTAQAPSKATADRYTLSGQLLGLQTLGAGAWPGEFMGVQINLLGVGQGDLKVKQVLAEYAPAAYAGFGQTIAAAHRRIETIRKVLGDPPDQNRLDEIPMALSEQVCMTAYGRCRAWSLCQFGLKAGVAKIGVEGR